MARLPRALDPLRERNFRAFFFGQAISLLGTGMVGVALSFAVLDLTGSVSDLGFVFAARTTPLVVFLLVGGVFADRLPRRAVMLGSDLVQCLAQGLLAALLLSGVARLWELLLLQAIAGTATAFFTPAVTGLTTEIVDAERLQEANALRSLSSSLGNIAGPAISGVLVATVGAGWALAGDAASFAASAACLAGLRLPPHERLPAQSVLADLLDGWREFSSRTWLLVANVHAALVNMLVLAPFFVLGAAVAKRSLGGAGAWSLIVSAFGVGLVTGGLVALRFRPRRPMLVGLPGACLWAAPLALLAERAPAVAIAPFALLAGAHLAFLNTVWETTLQEQIPPALLSRVTSYDWVTALVFQPVGYAVAGLVAGHLLGVRGTLWLGAAAALVTSVAIVGFRSVRTLEARPRRREPPVAVPASDAS